MIEDPLGLDKDYDKESVVRYFSCFFSLWKTLIFSRVVRYFLEIDLTKEQITS